MLCPRYGHSLGAGVTLFSRSTLVLLRFVLDACAAALGVLRYRLSVDIARLCIELDGDGEARGGRKTDAPNVGWKPGGEPSKWYAPGM
jgi:hypothetical protein